MELNQITLQRHNDSRVGISPPSEPDMRFSSHLSLCMGSPASLFCCLNRQKNFFSFWSQQDVLVAARRGVRQFPPGNGARNQKEELMNENSFFILSPTIFNDASLKRDTVEPKRGRDSINWLILVTLPIRSGRMGFSTSEACTDL